jgi:hypothetical protein
MAPLPDAVKQLAENMKWTTDLGNAFLAQQSDLMDSVQRMRMKAKSAGNLKSTEQQKVETKTVETKTVVVIEQAKPEVIYVPSYNPTVVYGPPAYPYPPIVYPPPRPTGAYVAGIAISFGVGLAMGAAWGGGGWGYNCGWGHGHNDITINNNSFVNNSNPTNVNRPSQRPAVSGNNWQHNPAHRGGAPTQTGPRLLNMAVLPEVIPWPRGRQAHVRTRAGGNRPARWIAATPTGNRPAQWIAAAALTDNGLAPQIVAAQTGNNPAQRIVPAARIA